MDSSQVKKFIFTKSKALENHKSIESEEVSNTSELLIHIPEVNDYYK